MNEAHSSADPSGSPTYETPQLQRFGDVAELTHAIGNMGAKDGGPSPMHSTSV